MSKSLGNLTLVGDLLKDYSPDAIRITLLRHHYRHPWECFAADLQASTEAVELFQRVRTIVGKDLQGEDHMLRNRFKVAMDGDFDTPEAILLLKEAAEKVVATHDVSTGAEILRLTPILGLHA